MDPQLALYVTRADYDRRLRQAAQAREVRRLAREQRATRRRRTASERQEQTAYLVVLGNWRIA
ncbi:hypothetical protein [Xylanimonas ulmi]|uniref:Uncharacterized protein n=1 Tax=Xylanimonas ulmi TaxID=228973 RepID=A0A4Q7M4N4_9MICO|nr:hypothetical protein [Xylanibacterium ulmi]RZS61498.1 hypothetical protein EV386_1801 [Xylanibacterium ulmi]